MSAETQFTCVLFDVDGTLVDSAPAVIHCFNTVLSKRGVTTPPADAMRKYVGPPLWWSFADLGFEGEIVKELVDEYRGLYRTIFLEPPLFPRMDEVVRGAHNTGIPVATATSKQEPLALAQMEHLGILDAFDVIAGATPGPGSSKATVIADALSRLSAKGMDISRPVLIGDSCWDVEGAQQAGIDVMGVSWGYAKDGDLDECIAIAHTPEELAHLLGFTL